MQEDGQKGGLWSVQNTVGHKEKVYFYSSFSQAGHIPCPRDFFPVLWAFNSINTV